MCVMAFLSNGANTWPRGYKLEDSLLQDSLSLLTDTCPQVANHCALF